MILRNRILIAGAIFACILVVSFCSKKSTGPSGNEPAEATAIIGPEGGTLAVDDFSLTVPPGAFDGSNTLQLSASSESSAFGDSRVTREFRVGGFPGTFSKPLRLAIRTEKALSGEVRIAMGEPCHDILTGGSATVYRYLPAVDSSGHLVCLLAPGSRGRTASQSSFHRASDPQDPFLLDLMGVSVEILSTTPSFSIIGPRGRVTGQEAAAVENMIVDCYNAVREATGLDFTEHWPTLPVVVCIGPFSDKQAEDDFAVFSSSLEGEWWMCVDLNLIRSNRTSQVRVFAGMNLLLYSMLSSPIIEEDMDETRSLADRWLHLAIMHWSEELFSENPNYQAPFLFPGNEMAPFRGMVKGATYLNAKHDQGMSAVFKFLFGKGYFTKSELLNTYRVINGYGVGAPEDPVEGLLSNVRELITVWWPDFFKSYITGGVYGVAPSVFLDPYSLSGTWTIDPDGAAEKVFSSADSRVGAYPDLSAKLFLVDAGDSDMPENASLLIDVEGEVTDQGLSALVFAVHPDRLEYLGGGPATSSNPEIRNLKANAEGGVSQYLICVVNSTSHDGYLGSTGVDLKLTISSAHVFDEFRFGITVMAHFHGENNGSITESDRLNIFQVSDGEVEFIGGSMTSSFVFEGSFSTTDGHSGNVRAEFNESFSQIRFAQVNMDYIWPNGFRTHDDFTAIDLPVVYDETEYLQAFKLGNEVCNYLTEVHHRDDYSGNAFQEVTGFWCTEGSNVSMTFHKRLESGQSKRNILTMGR